MIDSIAAWYNIWLAPVFLVLMLIMSWSSFTRYKIIQGLAAPAWRKDLILNYSTVRACLRLLALMVALGTLWGAFLRPQSADEQIIPQEGRDVLIALDVSRSMLAQDLKPSRLEHAKKKIKQLVRSLSCDRVGLILYAGSAVVQCPLTTDYAAFEMFLNAIDAQTISSGSTALDTALSKAMSVYQEAHDRASKLVVVFTDGEDFSSNLTALKDKVAQLGIKLFTVGVGTAQGAPIPMYDLHGNTQGHIKDDAGAPVISKLNEGILSALAMNAGGVYVPTTLDNKDIDQLINLVQKFERERLDEKKLAVYQEYFHYLVAGALVALLMEWFL